MTYLVEVKPGQTFFTVELDETVADAAFRQGFEFPTECFSGMCATCRGKILSGQVRYAHEITGLTAEEIAAGYALFCSAMPESDLVIEVEDVLSPAQMIRVRKMDVALARVEPLTTTITKLCLTSQQGDIPHLAGQYLQVTLPSGQTKPYSIANAPLDLDTIELHIKHTSHHGFANQLLETVKKTGELAVSVPHGTMYFRQQPQRPIVMIAMGTGFAPMKAMIEHALADGYEQPIHLYWVVSAAEDFYLEDLLQRWDKHVPQFHFHPRAGERHIAVQVLAEHPGIADYHVYVAGSQAMVDACYGAFLSEGLAAHFFYSDILPSQPRF